MAPKKAAKAEKAADDTGDSDVLHLKLVPERQVRALFVPARMACSIQARNVDLLYVVKDKSAVQLRKSKMLSLFNPSFPTLLVR